MIKELYRLRLVIILAIVAVLLGGLRFKYRNYQWPEATPQVLAPSPTLVPTVTSAPEIEVVYPLIELLPYKGNGFIVDSYSAPMTLNVVTSGNIKTVTSRVHKWMLENKVATESHKLVFSSQ